MRVGSAGKLELSSETKLVYSSCELPDEKVLTALVALKEKYPRQVTLLAGNQALESGLGTLGDDLVGRFFAWTKLIHIDEGTLFTPSTVALNCYGLMPAMDETLFSKVRIRDPYDWGKKIK